MAVTQISKIQVRHGLEESGTGVPQLDTAEFGWAIDTQKLYIGNGTVNEGAPTVGNTRILTEHDLSDNIDLLTTATYSYEVTNPDIITGPTINDPIFRTIQDRLDDNVSTASFGSVGDGVKDDTLSIQRAIKEIFLDALSINSDGFKAKARKKLIIPAGVFNITDTLYIPSYSTITGAGIDKTIINLGLTITGSTNNSTVITTNSLDINDNLIGAYVSGPGVATDSIVVSVIPGQSVSLDQPTTTAETNEQFSFIFRKHAIQFVNDSSTSDGTTFTPDVDITSLLNQPSQVVLENLTIQINSDTEAAIILNSIKNCVFNNVAIRTTVQSIDTDSKGIVLTSESEQVTCKYNRFNNVVISGFNFGVYSSDEINYNTFSQCELYNVSKGFLLGESAGTYGPRNTVINNTRFYNISEHAVYIEKGSNNSVESSSFENVGNYGTSDPVRPNVYFGSAGNFYNNNTTDRDILGQLDSTVLYVPELAGTGQYSTAKQLVPLEQAVDQFAFRLPIPTDSTGATVTSASYIVDYIYTSEVGEYIRTGKLGLTVNANTSTINVSDTYDFISSDLSTTNVAALTFTAQKTSYGINVYYSNTLISDAGNLVYSFTAQS